MRPWASMVLLTVTVMTGTEAPALGRPPGAVGRVVARIRYGEQASQVGMLWGGASGAERFPPKSAAAMVVDSRGRLYLADVVNGEVKRFSSDGSLELATVGHLANMQNPLAVDNAGSIYADQEVGTDSLLVKFDRVTGKQTWQKAWGQLLAQDLAGDVERTMAVTLSKVTPIARLAVAPDGDLLVGVVARRQGTARGFVLWFAIDGEGVIQRVLPAGAAGLLADGRPYSYVPTESDRSRCVFALYGEPGQVVGNITIRLRPSTLSKPLWGKFDTQGNLWLTLACPETRALDFKVRNAIPISQDVMYAKYSQNGALLGAWRFPDCSPPASQGSCVDPTGNLWHMRFREDALEVIEYSGAPEIPHGRIVWELWSEESPAGPMVALAEVAEATGATVRWDNAARQASLRTATGVFLFDPRAGVVRSARGAPLASAAVEIRHRRVWAQADALRNLCGLPIYSASGGRLVYSLTPVQAGQP